MEKLRLGEILVATGQISENQLSEALKRRRITGRRIGEELVAAGDLSDDLLARSLRLQRRLVFAAFFAIISAAGRGIGCAEAAEARAFMAVTATVVDSVSIRAVHQAQNLVITAEDVGRGYVEVAAGSRFEIGHNGLCLFEFRPLGDIFRSVRVSGPEGLTAEFGSGGGTMLQKSAGRESATVAVNYRFQLAPGVRAGAYNWPLSLTVLPM